MPHAQFVGVVVVGVELLELMSVDEPVVPVEPVVPEAPMDVPLPVEDELSVLAVLGVVELMLPLDEVSALVVGAVDGAVVVLDVVSVEASRWQAERASAEAAIRARAALRARGVVFIRDTP